MFLFGQIDMPIKLVPGHSAGTVLAFYLTSDQPNRDESDFQFLGNVSGQPYILQTSLYADDFDNREEIIYLWFDPTKDFHTYSFLWNLHQIGLNHVRTLKGHEHMVMALVFVEREVPLCISGDNGGGGGVIFIWGIEDEKPVAALMVCDEDLRTRPVISKGTRFLKKKSDIYIYICVCVCVLFFLDSKYITIPI
ncbi:putative xyloglucan:xyloglucosyl transferase [Helianthus annuus]|nr:putative xyloglucan:xyloglucosyl transferase [Helianthus annuus]